MKWLATLVLAVFNLIHVTPPASLQKSLESKLVDATPKVKMIELAPHSAVVTPTKTGNQPMTPGAVSALGWDADSSTVIFSKNPQQKMPIASITKLITTLVIIRDHSLDEKVTVPQLPSYSAEDVKLNLVPGQQFVLKDLLAGALIPSANDAADTLALYNSKTKEAFSAKMNQLVSEWGITDVHFTNPSGLSDADNYATAESLAKIASLALTNSTVASLVQTAHKTITDTAGKPYELNTTDALLGSDGRIKGIKTGFTGASGQCFVSLAIIKGHRVITVVLNSPDRFAETQALVNWIESNYTWQ